jgi:hypothetical protein
MFDIRKRTKRKKEIDDETLDVYFGSGDVTRRRCLAARAGSGCARLARRW